MRYVLSLCSMLLLVAPSFLALRCSVTSQTVLYSAVVLVAGSSIFFASRSIKKNVLRAFFCVALGPALVYLLALLIVVIIVNRSNSFLCVQQSVWILIPSLVGSGFFLFAASILEQRKYSIVVVSLIVGVFMAYLTALSF